MSVRKKIINSMLEINNHQADCSKCIGTCCTFEANSMMITPYEAYCVAKYILDNNIDKDQEINKCIDHYRLNKEIPSNGQRNLIRRTYTCPFYEEKVYGCMIPKEHKPLGCLSFNPIIKNQIEGGQCKAYFDIDKEINHDQDFINQNNLITEKYQVNWKKAPIPLAVREILQKLK